MTMALTDEQSKRAVRLLRELTQQLFAGNVAIRWCLACGRDAEPVADIRHERDCPVGEALALIKEVGDDAD